MFIEVHIPVVVLVLGGDRFTLEKIANVTSQADPIPVVVVDGSGTVASMLADCHRFMQSNRTYSAILDLKLKASGRRTKSNLF